MAPTIAHDFRRRLAQKYGLKCVWCGRKIRIKDRKKGNAATLEHLCPQFFGGSDEIDNLALACRECNSSRFHLHAYVFYVTRLMEGHKPDREQLQTKLRKLGLVPEGFELPEGIKQLSPDLSHVYSTSFKNGPSKGRVWKTLTPDERYALRQHLVNFYGNNCVWCEKKLQSHTSCQKDYAEIDYLQRPTRDDKDKPEKFLLICQSCKSISYQLHPYLFLLHQVMCGYSPDRLLIQGKLHEAGLLPYDFEFGECLDQFATLTPYA